MVDKIDLVMTWLTLKDATDSFEKRWDVSSYAPVRSLDDYYLHEYTKSNNDFFRYLKHIENLRKPDQIGKIWLNLSPHNVINDENGNFKTFEYNGPSWDQMTEGIANKLFRIEKGLVYQGYATSKLNRDLDDFQPKCIIISDDPNFAWPAFIRHRCWKKMSDDPDFEKDFYEIETYLKNLNRN